MIPPLRSFDDVDGKERGQKKTDDLRAMTALGPRTLLRVMLLTYTRAIVRFSNCVGLSRMNRGHVETVSYPNQTFPWQT